MDDVTEVAMLWQFGVEGGECYVVEMGPFEVEGKKVLVLGDGAIIGVPPELGHSNMHLTCHPGAGILNSQAAVERRKTVCSGDRLHFKGATGEQIHTSEVGECTDLGLDDVAVRWSWSDCHAETRLPQAMP